MTLVVHFPRPGFFMADMPVTVTVDGEVVYRGSFVSGFTVPVEVGAGEHVVETAIGLGFLVRRRRLVVLTEERDEVVTATLSYSRMWGNFEEKCALAAGAPEARVAFGQPEAEELPAPREPVRATWVLLAVLAAFFVLEHAAAVGPRDGASPSLDTLDALGGLGPTALRDGEAFRLVTCTFLHVDPVHLFMNGIALVMAGVLVERTLGAARFLVLYFLGGLGGSLVSLALNRGDMISVGASGAVLGVFGAGLVLAELYPAAQRPQLRIQLARVLVPSLLPMLGGRGEHVDFGAHLGGAVTGALVGAAMLSEIRGALVRGDKPRVAWPRAAAAVGGLGVVLAFALVATRSYPRVAALASILRTVVPNEELPVQGQPSEETYARWAKEYPDDPRVLAWQAGKALDRSDAEAFETAVTKGRAAVVRTGPAFSEETRAHFTKTFDGLEADRAMLLLVPRDELPKGTSKEIAAGWDAKIASFAAKYPKDPRVQLELTMRAYFDAHDPKAALEHVKATRDAVPAVRSFFPKGLDVDAVSAVEVFALTDLGRRDEAKALELRVCREDGHEIARRMLTSNGLCRGTAAP